jgi:hypothetical protein
MPANTVGQRVQHASFEISSRKVLSEDTSRSAELKEKLTASLSKQSSGRTRISEIRGSARKAQVWQFAPWPPTRGIARIPEMPTGSIRADLRKRMIFYQYRADRARRTLREIGSSSPTRRNRLPGRQRSNGTVGPAHGRNRSVNRDLD